jgi:hypothetical protein
VGAKVKDETALFDEGATATAEEPSSNGSGWENGPVSEGAVCVSELGAFKRHSWAGTDTCERCGAVKERPASPTKEPGAPARTRGIGRTGELETAISLAWMGLGIAVEKQPWLGNVYMNRETGEYVTPTGDEESRPVTITEAVGKTLQMESSIAGKRIDRALRRTPLYRVLVPYFATAGVVADLAPLLAPPLVIGLATARPDIGEKFKPMMVALLLPVLAEQAKMAEAQMELMSKVEGVNAEVLERATAMVDDLLGL